MSIYKIQCLTTDDFYIGSTNNFTRRRYEHRNRYNCNTKNSNDKLYDFMRLNGGLDNFEFSILEEDISINKRLVEQKYINELKPTLNAIKSYATEEDKRLSLCKNSTRYRLKYPDKVKEYDKEYKKKEYDCECGKTIKVFKKARHERTKNHINNTSTLILPLPLDASPSPSQSQ